MSESVGRYRYRWMADAGVVVVERRREYRAFGFWPTYLWEVLAHFPSTEEAVKWIIDRAPPSPHTEKGE